MVRESTINISLTLFVLGIQGPDPHEYYPGKTADHTLVQKIKEAYGDVEKGVRGYTVASIESGVVHLTCQLIIGNLYEIIDQHKYLYFHLTLEESAQRDYI